MLCNGKKEHDLTSSSLSVHVHRSVWQPTIICLQCNHQEMPGKCFNLPILIQNARTNIPLIFWLGLCSFLCTAPSHFFFSLNHSGIDPTQQGSILTTQGSQLTILSSTLVLLSKALNPAQRPTAEDSVWTVQFLGMTACGCVAGRYCKRAHAPSVTLPG